MRKLHQSKLWKYPDGLHSDGNNLYLQVRGNARSWVYRSNKCQMGLGSLRVRTLAEAREMALEILKQEHDGLDPKAERERARRNQEIGKGSAKTMTELADEYVEAFYRDSAPSTRDVVQSHLRKVHRTIGGMLIGDVTSDIILADNGVGLRKMYDEKPTAANEVRMHLERMFHFASHNGYPVHLHHGKNPAEWKGHLQFLLKKKPHIIQHRTPLPYQDVPRFMVRLRICNTVLARLIEFQVLTGVRTNEVRLATLGEFDLENMVWTVPWQHLKKGKTHQRNKLVPITSSMLRVLRRIQWFRRDQSPNALVFARPDGGPYNKTQCSLFIRTVLKWDERVPCPDGVMRLPVPHGFRSTLRDWCRVNRQEDLLWKFQTDHVTGDKSDQAYGHDRLLEQRRIMMTAYNDFCDGLAPVPATQTDNVAQINEARKRRRAS
jgi:integrase